MNDVTQRFIEMVDDIQRTTGLTQTQVERRCGFSYVLSNIRNKGVDPSTLTCSKLLKAFPQYSSDYLMRGEGTMYASTSDLAIALNEMTRQRDMLLKLNLTLQERR